MLFGIAAAPNAAQPQARPALQPVAILTVISGDVLMRSARGDFSSAVDGAVLYAGAMLRTSANARALITLFEGSTVELDPASDITIEDAATRGGSTVAQALGRGWNVVMRLTSADSRYEPSTPAATASVRGGEFEVAAADAASGLMATPTVPEQHVATTVAVSTTAKTIAAAQTTNARSNSAPVSMRSAVGAERIRKVVTAAVVSRARPAARSRDGAHEHDGAED
jgi:hypothetical protein